MLTEEWRKSSRSGDNTNQSCVEVRLADGTVQVRDTKLGEDSPILDLDRITFAALLTDLKHR